MHFHRDVLTICDGYPAEVLRSGTDDIFAGSAPLGFTYGLGSLLLFPMRRGSSTVLLEQSSPQIMLQTVQDFRVTTLLIGPTMYRGMAPLTDRYDLSGLHTCCSAGEHLPVAVYEEWLRRTGIRILDFMGCGNAPGAPPAATRARRCNALAGAASILASCRFR